jgi:hypothetical protein
MEKRSNRNGNQCLIMKEKAIMAIMYVGNMSNNESEQYETIMSSITNNVNNASM